MVGQPKRLSDLARIEADVRITCGRCHFEDDWTRNDLARHLAATGGSQVWSEITRHLRCRRADCGSTDLRAVPVPYARRPANMLRRVSRLDAHVVGTALTILEQAVARSKNEAVATLEVRLALLVVHRYARERELVQRFWQRAGLTLRNVNDGLTEPLQSIRARLVQLGWIAPTVLLERERHWPWDSPPPPGWLAPPHRPRPDSDGRGAAAGGEVADD